MSECVFLCSSVLFQTAPTNDQCQCSFPCPATGDNVCVYEQLSSQRRTLGTKSRFSGAGALGTNCAPVAVDGGMGGQTISLSLPLSPLHLSFLFSLFSFLRLISLSTPYLSSASFLFPYYLSLSLCFFICFSSLLYCFNSLALSLSPCEFPGRSWHHLIAFFSHELLPFQQHRPADMAMLEAREAENNAMAHLAIVCVSAQHCSDERQRNKDKAHAPEAILALSGLHRERESSMEMEGERGGKIHHHGTSSGRKRNRKWNVEE